MFLCQLVSNNTIYQYNTFAIVKNFAHFHVVVVELPWIASNNSTNIQLSENLGNSMFNVFLLFPRKVNLIHQRNLKLLKLQRIVLL